ncbi:ABC transporter ATP-binding protein [Virgibacillus siamensis]|uniref:ABC transporter ATP-binding protein n=1 Tax=Virgibacillus siamensis TaxID=480071 RepID=UPI00098502B1|nr:ABC transporter ATP-binding protein [Virgibacillus siamensis]
MGQHNHQEEESLVTLKEFSFAYDSISNPLLSNLDFTLYNNEVTLLMGASGCGKSTIALCLNGLYPEAVEGESAGYIFFKGKNITKFPQGVLNQRIGIVFQDPESQFCMITVEDELAFTLENINTPTSKMTGLITEALQKVGMEDYKDCKLHELSGGEKQKIALAAVLLLEPELLILDEATVNLDPASTLEFVQLIQSIQAERNMAIMIIDHQADDWLDFTDRILIIGKEGRIIADDHPDKLFTERKHLLKQEGIFLPKMYDNDTLVWSPSPPTSDPVMNLKGIRYNRKKKQVLNEINMDIMRGELISIVGQNGAGKSTLLEVMASILKPDSGIVSMLGKPLHQWNENELRKRMGFVFQNPEHQFITDTVYDEITFGMKLHHYSEERIQQTASLLLKQFRLDQHKFNNPFALSGGQKRRLSVATALDDTPDILLFDEPTFGQDAQATENLMKIILDLKVKGIAIVFVTHDMNLAALSDRIFVLHKGEVAFSGKPDNLWKQDALLRYARLRLPYHIRGGQLEEVYDYIH